ncbi:MAG: thioredoxin family protein [Bacteroidales bacterium]|nr:thioredoxin family protein [Bacteroidales bacterium]
MKKILVLLIMLLPFMIQAQDWQTDFETAKSLAAEQDKPIILVFQGSDWCAPCIKLEKEIWSSEDFIAYSKEHYIMLKADFPRKRQNSLSAEQQEKNNALAEKYNKEGYFPLVVVLDKEGKVLGTTGYKKLTPSEYIEFLNSFIQ